MQNKLEAIDILINVHTMMIAPDYNMNARLY